MVFCCTELAIADTSVSIHRAIRYPGCHEVQIRLKINALQSYAMLTSRAPVGNRCSLPYNSELIMRVASGKQNNSNTQSFESWTWTRPMQKPSVSLKKLVITVVNKKIQALALMES